MKDLFTVMKFTMKDMIQRKSFIVSTVIILILIFVGFNVPNVIKSIKGDNSKDKLVIVDEDNIFENSLESLKTLDPDYEIEIETGKQNIDDIKQKIQNEDIKSAIIIENDSVINFKYIVKSSNMMTQDAIPQKLMTDINSIYSNVQISKLGLTQTQLESLTPKFNYSIEQTDDQHANGNIFTMMILSIILFYAIYFCAYQVSSSITTEKTSKIMETLVTSTTPRTIVLGKTIGIGIVGLLQLIVMVTVALISANLFLDKEMLAAILDMSSITPYLGIITIVYFILGYFSYALLYALTGSTVSKPEDIQSANSPIALIAVVGFYLSYFTMMNPTSQLNNIAAMLPISSPFCMPFRIMMGLASTTDVIISIAILIVTILIIARVAIKIYSNAILNYGTKMSISDIVKMYKDKNN